MRTRFALCLLVLTGCGSSSKSPAEKGDAAVTSNVDAGSGADADGSTPADAGSSDASVADASVDAGETPAGAGEDGPAIGGPLFLSIDGRSSPFNYTAMKPIIDATFLKVWDLGNKRAPGPLVSNEVYTNLELQTAGNKDLLDPTLTAADITEVALDITYSVDEEIASGWTLTISNPAKVAGAKFSFSNKDGKISCHVEGMGSVKDVNADRVPSFPALVFEANGLPGAK